MRLLSRPMFLFWERNRKLDHFYGFAPVLTLLVYDPIHLSRLFVLFFLLQGKDVKIFQLIPFHLQGNYSPDHCWLLKLLFWLIFFFFFTCLYGRFQIQFNHKFQARVTNKFHVRSSKTFERQQGRVVGIGGAWRIQFHGKIQRGNAVCKHVTGIQSGSTVNNLCPFIQETQYQCL